MPITQDRLVSVIAAADAAFQRLDFIRELTKHTAARIRLGLEPNSESQQLFDGLHTAIMQYIDDEVMLVRAIERERAHFQYSAKSNTRSRDKMRQLRLRQKVQRKATSVERELQEFLETQVNNLGGQGANLEVKTPMSDPQMAQKAEATDEILALFHQRFGDQTFTGTQARELLVENTILTDNEQEHIFGVLISKGEIVDLGDANFKLAQLSSLPEHPA